ncbi:MAG: ABC transporter ATP-binding protein [Cellulosilyticaceae bacterium]
MSLLQVKDLHTYFHTKRGTVKAVNGVSFDIEEGQTLAIVGESGCGKSITSMSIMKLIEMPPGEIAKGEIIFQGEDLVKKTPHEMQKVRGNKISMIFQEPMTALNPVFKIGLQLSEPLMLHRGMNKQEAREKSIEMLKLVGIPRAESLVDDYPHQLSGGMRQRVMIAMALCCEPALLIADEPTTALDVTIQAQILRLMNELKDKMNTSIMLITHDLGVVAEMADHVVVMYAGKVVENASVSDIFNAPRHPYTIGLMGSIPDIEEETERLVNIAGVVPNPLDMPTGCPFNPRCERATDKCRQEMPELNEVVPGHKVRCFYPEEVK